MNVTSYPNAAAFLARAQPALEEEEALNSLILGVCLRLTRQAEEEEQRPREHQARPFLATVEDGGRLLLAAMLTPPHHIVLAPLAATASAAIPPLIDELRGRNISLPGVLGPTAIARAFAQAWADHTGAAYHLRMHQCLHALNEVRTVPSVSGDLRVAAESDVELITGWVRAFQMEALDESGDEAQTRKTVAARVAAGDYVLWEDGRPVSMALKTRPTRHGVSITAVYTPPALRGRGYATACVAALSRRLLARGYHFCTLYTDLANPTSNNIYRRIGYRPLADFDLYQFNPPQLRRVP